MEIIASDAVRHAARRRMQIMVMLTVTILFSALPAAWAGPATESLRCTVNQVVKFLNAPELKAPEKREERRTIVQRLLDEKVDKVEIARRALGAHWQNRTPAERQDFIRLFSELLEQTYFEKLDGYVVNMENFSEQSIVYLAEKAMKGYTIVETKVLVNKESEVAVSYLLKKTKDAWLVCDIALEGVSLLKNYRVQFNEILANESFAGLLKKLEAKQVQGGALPDNATGKTVSPP